VSYSGLGTRLRTMLELMDSDVASILSDLGEPDYRPRFTPVVRALVDLGPLSIRALASAIGVTHSAASQTVAQMKRQDLVHLAAGSDGRERIVDLTTKARALLPKLEAEWAATEAAAAELDAELPYPLDDLVTAVLAALEQRSFRRRIEESGWMAAHPEFARAIGIGS
jgi:DNA-binding MarR family transcriptional regulator